VNCNVDKESAENAFLPEGRFSKYYYLKSVLSMSPIY
jgi:hypothetical protein